MQRAVADKKQIEQQYLEQVIEVRLTRGEHCQWRSAGSDARCMVHTQCYIDCDSRGRPAYIVFNHILLYISAMESSQVTARITVPQDEAGQGARPHGAVHPQLGSRTLDCLSSGF
jgi:hypothetical protein